VRTLVETWLAAHGSPKRVVTLRLWGKAMRAFKAGVHMTPLPGYGRETFATFAAREAQQRRAASAAKQDAA
jgi:hypothetical protein